MDYNKFFENYRKNHEEELSVHTEELLIMQERRKQQEEANKLKFKRRVSDIKEEPKGEDNAQPTQNN